MATFNSKDIVDRIVEENGYDDPADPRFVAIIEYTNMVGNRCWGVVSEGDQPSWLYKVLSYLELQDAKPYWFAKDVLTIEQLEHGDWLVSPAMQVT